MGKIPVWCNDVPGFVSNRVLQVMINEALHELYEGVAPAENIDNIMKLGMNHPMGPLELADLIGLDTILSILTVMYNGYGDTKYRPSPLLRQYVQAGWLGRKAGKGIYDYYEIAGTLEPDDKEAGRLYNNVLYEKKENIVLLTINRPKALNALNKDTLLDIKAAVQAFRDDNDSDVMVITGAGDKSFVAEADITFMSEMGAMDARAFGQLGGEVFTLIEKTSKPIIAAINGFCLGGGCELAISLTSRISSDKGKFGQPEVGLRVTPGFGGTQRLPRIVGTGQAKQLLYSGDVIDAAEALRIGLINAVYAPDQLMEQAMNAADSSPRAVGRETLQRRG